MASALPALEAYLKNTRVKVRRYDSEFDKDISLGKLFFIKIFLIDYLLFIRQRFREISR